MTSIFIDTGYVIAFEAADDQFHNIAAHHWRYFIQHHDKTHSLTDCVSFLVMERLGIRTALTFDHHFVQAGFEKLP